MLSGIVEKYHWRTNATITTKTLTTNTHMQCDARLMPLAISNLLANSVCYAKACIQVEYAVVGNQQLICVSDDGEGITTKYTELRTTISPFAN